MTAETGPVAAAEAVLDLAATHGHWAAFQNSDQPADFVCACGLPWIEGEGCSFVQGVRAAAARLADPAATDTSTQVTITEYGVERSLPQWNSGEPYIEWGGSVGMSHNYPYTAESVWGLADGRPVWTRTRTKFADVVSEPVRAVRDTTEPERCENCGAKPGDPVTCFRCP